MKVFKFGGASVKSADAVKNVANILQEFKNEHIVVVISAMGKTTNAFESVVDAYYNKKSNSNEKLNAIKSFHYEIVHELFKNALNNEVFTHLNTIFQQIEAYLTKPPTDNYDFEYDQIVSQGEIISSIILSAYLNLVGLNNQWLDARRIIITDNLYREAAVDWAQSSRLISNDVLQSFEKKQIKLVITQGFIGGTTDNRTTTLGREGSDYTAAIIAYALQAESVTIWKDVDGVLNADPKYFSNTQKIDYISYHEAIELAYYGASVIHPKTIKPLQNKNIPLLVKSFLNPNADGTLISKPLEKIKPTTSFIFKVNQILLSILPKDFSFIAEDNLSEIFGMFAKHHIKINVMQNSAISFSVCIDNDKQKVKSLMVDLQKSFIVKYNEDLELVTIRHYNQETIEKVTENKRILLEQRSRTTIQLVVKELTEKNNKSL